MAAPKQTKKQRLDEAREQAKLAREQRERRQKRLKVLVPTLISVGVLALAAVIVLVIAIQPKPAPSFPGGPRNMASDGIVFEQGSGDAPAVKETAALKRGQKPTTTEWPENDGKAHVVTYVDWTCPSCQQFESINAETLSQLAASGQGTLEVRPVAILDANYTSDRFSTRAANVAACVANYAPEHFLDVQGQFYENQPEEQGPGLTTARMLELVKAGGVDDERVDACVRGLSYERWVAASTQRATSTDGFRGTPTVFVNGDQFQGQYNEFSQFLQQHMTAS